MNATIPATTMSRAQRRQLGKRPRPGARKPRSTFNPLAMAIGSHYFRQRFDDLLALSEQQCLISDNIMEICRNAGRLLFVTLKALELKQMTIDEDDVADALQDMALAMGDALESDAIDQPMRSRLITGCNYLEAITTAIPLDALGAAWFCLDQLLDQGDLGTATMVEMLNRVGCRPEPQTPPTTQPA